MSSLADQAAEVRARAAELRANPSGVGASDRSAVAQIVELYGSLPPHLQPTVRQALGAATAPLGETFTRRDVQDAAAKAGLSNAEQATVLDKLGGRA